MACKKASAHSREQIYQMLAAKGVDLLVKHRSHILEWLRDVHRVVGDDAVIERYIDDWINGKCDQTSRMHDDISLDEWRHKMAVIWNTYRIYSQ